jgi:uncharacterized protein (DUF952 family)
MVPREYYDVQPADQDYQPEPMATGKEEFIHCTTGPQNMVDTAHRYYRNDPRSYYLLVIDLDKVRAPTRYDAPNQIYPHIYGPLNRDAILEVRNFERAPDGTFLLPDPA